MRFFICLVALAVAVTSGRAAAQSNVPVDAQPLQSEAPPDAPPAPTPAPDAKPVTPPPDARTDDGCGVVPVGLGSAIGFGVTAGIGGLTTCVGGIMANIAPESSGDCVTDCINALFAAFVIVIGVVIAVAGLIVLGPAAAIAATVGAGLGAAGAGRKVWPSVVGGLPGIVVGIGGFALAIWGLTEAATVPFIAGIQFDPNERGHLPIAGGLGIAAASGVVSLAGSVIAEGALGAPDEDSDVEREKRKQREALKPDG